MQLKKKIQKILLQATIDGLDSDFTATAILFWLEWDTSLELAGNGWLDDDQKTFDAITDSDDSIKGFKEFLERAGVAKW